jgi:uncharacterized protein (UPF0332 family)
LLERAATKLSAAKILLREGYFDDAVSRAYYSMYFAARAILLTKDIVPKTHRGLISKFGLEFIDDGFIEKTYGNALNVAKEDREEADYSIICEITEEEAKSVITDADAFLKRINEAIEKLLEKLMHER